MKSPTDFLLPRQSAQSFLSTAKSCEVARERQSPIDRMYLYSGVSLIRVGCNFEVHTIINYRCLFLMKNWWSSVASRGTLHLSEVPKVRDSPTLMLKDYVSPFLKTSSSNWILPFFFPSAEAPSRMHLSSNLMVPWRLSFASVLSVYVVCYLFKLTSSSVQHGYSANYPIFNPTFPPSNHSCPNSPSNPSTPTC